METRPRADTAQVIIEPVRAADGPAVVDFLSGHPWPFHTGGTPERVAVQERIDSGWLTEGGTEAYWIATEDSRVGLLRIFDLDDGTPLFDLRIAPEHRGQGIGGHTVQWLTRHIFSTRPDIDRIEATTRADNQAMRRALVAAGWAKESHWRAAWPDPAGRPHDGVGYAILRADFDSGSVTPVDWHS